MSAPIETPQLDSGRGPLQKSLAEKIRLPDINEVSALIFAVGVIGFMILTK